MIIKDSFSAFGGVDFGFFALKEGVSEQDLIALAKKVEAEFLSEQEELLGHFLLRGENGTYVDCVFATTQEKAEQYCQQWLENATALAFLDLMEKDSVNLTFWTKIN